MELAKEAGFVPVTLGKRILRTETAGFTVLAWLMYRLEEAFEADGQQAAHAKLPGNGGESAAI